MRCPLFAGMSGAARYSVRMADGMLDTLRRRWDALAAVFLVPVLVLGGVEDWYGKTDAGDLLGSDAGSTWIVRGRWLEETGEEL